MKKISIIIPVYNTEKYIEKCLESLVNQTLKDIEIICVDDGSTDNSIDIVNKYIGKYDNIKLIRQEHKKQGAARNNALNIVTSEYIGFVDADDYVDLDYFEKLYKTAKKYDSDISVASILKHKKSYKKYNVLYKKEETAEHIQEKIKLCGDVKKFFFYAWNKIYRTDLIKNNEIKFSEGQIYEDVIFAVKALYYSNKVVSVPNTLYHYIEHSSSSIKQKDKTGKKKEDLRKAYTQLQEFCREKDINLPERLNYHSKYTKGIITRYEGLYHKKYTILGLIPLFRIFDYSEMRNLITFCGIKLKIAKKEVADARKANDFYKYKKNNVDITTVPQATGQLRDIQLANFALLKELDYVCKQNNLTYIIDAGTLLGAVRHKGYIPWDDDIDTLMPRESYEKIIDAFKRSSRNPDIYADYVRDKITNGQYFIKVQHKKCPFLFADIFPIDNYGKHLDLKEQQKITQKINKLIKSIRKKADKGLSNEQLKELLDNTTKNKILTEKDCNINGDIVYGIDSFHILRNWFVKYETIYPLKNIVFEGCEFPTVNNHDEFLKHIYQDYMSYPKKMKLLHSSYMDISDEHKKVIEKLKVGL